MAGRKRLRAANIERREGSGNVLVVRATEGCRGAAHHAAEAAATATAAAATKRGWRSGGGSGSSANGAGRR